MNGRQSGTEQDSPRTGWTTDFISHSKWHLQTYKTINVEKWRGYQLWKTSGVAFSLFSWSQHGTREDISLILILVGGRVLW